VEVANANVKLIVQPGDGIDPLLKAIKKAKKSIEIVIFRFDCEEIERALVEAVERGVFVHALIAFTNRGGEKSLRALETTFLAKGITVARTAGDLVRYHGKMMIVDRKELFLLAFNFTHLDIDHTRTFGIITRNTKLVQEAAKLFEVDTKRQNYAAGYSKFIVSPVNARKELAAFLKGAKKELLIYDPKISDKAILRIIDARIKAGVKVRVIGEVAGRQIEARKLAQKRLHTRTIIRDRRQAFVGSQSLKQLELDTRREIGIIFRDASVVSALGRIFDEDWKASAEQAVKPTRVKVQKAAKKLAKVVQEHLPTRPVAKRVLNAIKKNGGGKLPQNAEKIVQKTIEATVKDAVREAATEVVRSTAKEPANT
jgi:cardiolipin synthase A/B